MKREFNSVLREEMAAFLDLRANASYSSRMHCGSAIGTLDSVLVKNGKSERSLSEDDVRLFSERIREGGARQRTIIAKMTFLREFSDYLQVHGIPSPTVPIPKERDDYVPYIYSQDEIRKILEDADRIPGTKSGTYEFAMLRTEYPVILRILICCGTRLGETLSIRLGDFDSVNATLLLRNTKRNKERIIPMDFRLSQMIERYVSSMNLREKKSVYLFPGRNDDDHVSVGAFRALFCKNRRRLGIDVEGKGYHQRGACIHCFRHWFAINSYRKAQKEGWNVNDAIPYLSTYLGHEAFDKTEAYLKFSPDLFPETVEEFGGYVSDVFEEAFKDEERD